LFWLGAESLAPPFRKDRRSVDSQASGLVNSHSLVRIVTSISERTVDNTNVTGRQVLTLTAIKLLHTAIWAFFAGCILALPVAGLMHRFDWAVILTTLIVVECGVLALNRGRCPLTDWAGRFTDERRDNFDIFLPEWLARRNKAIFGTLFVFNELIVLWCRLA